MSDVDALMKRCQIGVGGRNALDEAHSIMAECYGTLGKLQSENARLREYITKLAGQVRQVNAEYQATTDFCLHLMARYEKRKTEDALWLIKHNAVMRSQPLEKM